MEQKTLNVQARQGRKKGMARRLRSTGKIPAVIYGHTEPTAITVDAREFRGAFKRITENTIVQLLMPEGTPEGTPGGTHEVLVKDYQKDNLTGEILHIDFYEFEKGKALRTRVPIRLTGNPVGVKEGGILEILLRELEVECLPKNLPEELMLDIAELALDRALHVKDMSLPEGVRPLQSLDQVVCLVAHRKVEEEAAPAAVEGEVPAEGEAAEEGEKTEESAEEKEE
jgi:large subunit ribosomal protein L25